MKPSRHSATPTSPSPSPSETVRKTWRVPFFCFFFGNGAVRIDVALETRSCRDGIRIIWIYLILFDRVFFYYFNLYDFLLIDVTILILVILFDFFYYFLLIDVIILILVIWFDYYFILFSIDLCYCFNLIILIFFK